MAIRTDIFSIDYSISPRIIWIDVSVASASAIDLYDTVSHLHAQANAMDEPHIIDAEGLTKLDEDGNRVGITVILINAVYAFAERTEWTICNMQGGNVVAFTDKSRDTSLYPRFPTAYVSADRTSSVSATMQEQDALQYSSYGGVISVDVTSENIGTAYPSGNMEYPVNNLDDGTDIGDIKGFAILSIRGNIDILETDVLDFFIIQGQNKSLTYVNIAENASVDDCTYHDATISGTLDGESTVEDCRVDGLSYVAGDIQHCELTEKLIQLGGGAKALFENCYSGVAGADTPEIDLGGSGQQIIGRGYVGGVRFSNRTGSDPASWDFKSGHAIIDASCTGEPIILRGSYKLTVEAGATYPNTEGRTMMESHIPDIAEANMGYSRP